MDSFGTRRKRIGLALALAFWGAAALQAQRPTGEIRIQVKDPSGAVTKASGTLRNLDTGATAPLKRTRRGPLILPIFRTASTRFGFRRTVSPPRPFESTFTPERPCRKP